MSETSKSGVWIDTKSDKIVESQPEEGIQLVAPGGPVTPEIAKRIERERAARSEGTKETTEAARSTKAAK